MLTVGVVAFVWSAIRIDRIRLAFWSCATSTTGCQAKTLKNVLEEERRRQGGESSLMPT
jgi:hypothetical protein